jgi:hypothetical protein
MLLIKISHDTADAEIALRELDDQVTGGQLKFWVQADGARLEKGIDVPSRASSRF